MTRRVVVISREGMPRMKTESRIQCVGDMGGRLAWLEIGEWRQSSQ